MSNLPRELSLEEITLKIEAPPNTDQVVDSKSWANIGQERAMKALEMGITIRAKGFNIFVAGDSGSGRHSAVMDLLHKHRNKDSSLRDIAYVWNFAASEKPRVITFPQGKASVFRDEIKQLIDRLKYRISRELDGEIYRTKRDRLIAETEQNENKILADFEGKLQAGGFRTVQTDDALEGPVTDIAPVVEGELVSFEILQDRVSIGLVPEAFWNTARERYFSFMDEMNRIYRDLRTARETLEESLDELKVETIHPGVQEEVNAVSNRWDDEAPGDYLRDLETDVLGHPDWFSIEKDPQEKEIDLDVRYGVNIVVDRHGLEELPIIHETNPTKPNLFGVVEARYDISGEFHTNFMMIRAGSLLRSDGGFLILHAEDLFAKEGLWPELKRALQIGYVEPEQPSTPLGPFPILMNPEPVAMRTKIILIGPSHLYETLCSQDEEFQKLFKVAAEFSPVIPRSSQTEREYAGFIRGLIKKENLRGMSPDGIRAVIAYGIILSEHRDKLSTRFGLIGDLIREADHWAGKAGKNRIDAEDVQEARDTRAYRNNLPEEFQNEQIHQGTLLIEVRGRQVGAANGLAVLERGFYSFGTPLRITAAVGPGKDGIINIEREAGLSGEIHDKGVLILEGFLRFRYARRQNLSLSASLAVEQSYYEIEGDSASASELAALLSAIAEVPIRQDVALTGAVNQRGILQPVRGIPEKVEGFFNACSVKGFTGTQGVVVPARNAQSILLSPKIIKAVSEGQFKIWKAETMDEVMTLLTGLPAGRKKRNGHFESRTLNARIEKGLAELAKMS